MNDPTRAAEGRAPEGAEAEPVVVPVPHPDPGWLRRLLRAAGLAVGATVILAVLATQLLGPARRPGSGSASANPSAVAVASPRATLAKPTPATKPTAPPSEPPVLLVTGDSAPTERLLVHGDGNRILDLGTGKLGPSLTGDWGDSLVDRGNGALTCVCLVRITGTGDQQVIVRIRDLAADGKIAADREVASYRGRVDPATAAVDQGDSVVVSTYVDPSGRLLFIGHSVRVPPVWKIGLDVVDVRSGRFIQSIHLDSQRSSTAAPGGAAPSGAAPTPNGGSGGSGRFAWAPTVTFSPDARHVLIQATVANQNQIEGTAYWTASLRSGGLGTVSRLRSGSGTLADEDCRENEGAFADADTLYSLCVNQSSGYKTIVRRIALDGAFISDSDISSLFAGRYVSGKMLSRQQDALYLWDPFGWTIARVDLGSGAVTSKTLDKAAISGSAAASDPVAGLGRRLGGWIAPSAAAKVWLEPSIAISPDGSRLYLLAVNGQSFTDVSGGSAGVLVLDPRTLELVAHWEPLADLVSIKASADGRFVYASGMSGVDAHGDETNQPASVTVYGAKTGKVAAFAGQLGNSWVMFDSGAPR